MAKTARHLWVNRKLYLVPRSSYDILKAIKDCFLGVETTAGNITFDGKQYMIALHLEAVFERFLTQWLMSTADGESDPILGDGSEIPVELQIVTEKTTRKLKEYSHEKKT